MNTSIAKPRCKAGELAFIINAPDKTSSNLGKVVSVVRLANPDEYSDDYSGVVWIVESAGSSLLVICVAGDSTVSVESCIERPMRDVDLFPIRDDEHENAEAGYTVCRDANPVGG